MPNYSSKHYAEVSRRYAEGTPEEVQALGVEKSAKDYNTEAKRYAEEAEESAGIAAEALSGKLDVDVGNATQTTKETIVGWGIPNRANAVSVSTGASYTAPSNGWLYVNIAGQRSTNEKIVITIGGIQYSYGRSLYDNELEDITAEILVSKGDVCTFTVTGTWTVKFIPCKQ